jgi:hypothetical protein
MLLPAVIFYTLLTLQVIAQPDSLPFELILSFVSSSQEAKPLTTRDFLQLLRDKKEDMNPSRSGFLDHKANTFIIETNQRDRGKQADSDNCTNS